MYEIYTMADDRFERHVRSGLLPIEYLRELRAAQQSERAARERIAALERELAEARAQHLMMIADVKQVHAAERRRREELAEAYLSTIQLLAGALEAKDSYMAGHAERTRAYTRAIADEYGVAAADLDMLEIGALLHDVGSLGMPDSILAKSGPLTPEEWQVLRQHPVVGAGLLARVPYLLPVMDMALSHHERWDGTGYPQRLAGPAIPQGARIIAVADAFDALTTDRAYRGRRNIGAAVQEILNGAGTQFDPAVVQAFMQAWKGNRLG